jgi:hypothetical protein
VIRQLGIVLLLAVAMAVGTWWLGWWAVPVIGAAWGVARYGQHSAWTAAVAAALAWVLLLGLLALRGPVGDLARIVGGALTLPGWVLVLATVVFPAALAGTAARLSRVLLALVE